MYLKRQILTQKAQCSSILLLRKDQKKTAENFPAQLLVTEYRDERQGYRTPSHKMTQGESGLQKFFQVIILKESCDFFFSNQNHANQRKEHKTLLSLALRKKHNKETSY